MGDDIKHYLAELTQIEMEHRQRLDEALPLGMIAVAVPSLLRFLGPYFASRGLQWGSKNLVTRLPTAIANITKNYPQTAAKLGLGNPEVAKLVTNASIRTGRALEKLGTASVWKLKTLPLALSRYYLGIVGGGHAAEALDAATDFSDDPVAQEEYRRFSEGSRNNDDDVRRLVTGYGFSDHNADKFIRFLEKSGLLSGTDSANKQLAAMMAELKRYPNEYLEFAKSL